MDTNVIALIKPDGERYVFMYDDGREREMMRHFGRFAGREDLSFTWKDAAALGKRVVRTRWKDDTSK